MDLNAPVSDTLVFFCNGQKISEKHPDPSWSLARYIRSKLQLTGCKIGCGVGACGACTIMVSSVDHSSRNISHIAVNACLYPLCAIHGKAVTTIEGIGSTKTKLHAVQERLAKTHGTQCGFCSPGMVMSMYTLLRNNPKPSSEEVMHAMEGNLCRCTGYRPILDAFKTFTEGGCCKGSTGEKCCQNGDAEMSDELYDITKFTEYDPTQDVIFPPELLTNDASFNQSSTRFTGDQLTWINAGNLEDVLRVKANIPKAVIIAGNTASGTVQSHEGVVIYTGHVSQLNSIELTETGLKVGATATMSMLQDAVKLHCNTLSISLHIIQQALKQYCSCQIRNVATIGGHLVTPMSDYDLVPLLIAVGAKVSIVDTDGNVRESTFNGRSYSSDDRLVNSNEILQYIEIPFNRMNEHVQFYKMSHKRNYLDNALVTAAFCVAFEADSDVVRDGRLVFGGLRKLPVFADATMKKLVGKSWNAELLETTCASLKEELQSDIKVSGKDSDYCSNLVAGSFFKFFFHVLQRLQKEQVTSSTSLSAIPEFGSMSSKVPHGSELFQPAPKDQPDIDSIGRPIVHRSALQHTSGEAVYADDLPPVQGELYIAFVLPSRGRARVLSTNLASAQEVEGYVTYVNADDISGVNKSTLDDHEVLVSKEVYSTGDIIGAIVATTPEAARKAAKLVHVSYEDLPVITTIEEAIEQEAFHHPIRSLQKGDVDEGFSQSSVVLEGTVRTAAQEHYYIEPTACIAIPSGEAGEIEMITCIQNVNGVQSNVALALGVDANKVNVKCKRAGGSFGGKSTPSSYIVVCALAAQKTGKAVRMVLPRGIDMQITGHREDTMAKYKVGFDDKTGKINSLDVTVYNNWGIPAGIHAALLGKTLFSIEGVYAMDSIHVTVKNCCTNVPSTKQARAFGIVQPLFIIESVITDIALKCGLPVLQVREVNMHKEDIPSTYYGIRIEGFDVFRRCWKECLDKSDYHNRRDQVNTFNSKNKWTKRGIAIVPLRFIVGNFPEFMHQAGAMVNLYLDGSVLIHHGGVEVGQGIHTKMIQIANRVLGIPVDKIHVAENSTHVVPNATDTAASYSTDLWGMAVKNACDTLIGRLAPYKSAKPDGNFADWVSSAYFARVNLSVVGYYQAPVHTWDWNTKAGNPYPYSTYGAACSEVQIDCLTGSHELLRTDIVMDVGKSLNPALDIGQIEGAFMMGYGYFMLEELLWDKDGTLITNGPYNYKIPCVRDIPAEFNITLLRNCPNARAVYSSKGIGEPSLCLASSVHFAIQDAIQSARADGGKSDVFTLETPATAERIHKACGELNFTKV
ncbi:xanthine dehydrogenase/oxidase-like [Amphiura filiformis]|uniref:xanthine dehydrogenase/oxidase-like n=1 Tax=Amphiura filiformis TaxID=82378 RepID=UPI003B21F4DA